MNMTNLETKAQDRWTKVCNQMAMNWTHYILTVRDLGFENPVSVSYAHMNEHISKATRRWRECVLGIHLLQIISQCINQYS